MWWCDGCRAHFCHQKRKCNFFRNLEPIIECLKVNMEFRFFFECLLVFLFITKKTVEIIQNKLSHYLSLNGLTLFFQNTKKTQKNFQVIFVAIKNSFDRNLFFLLTHWHFIRNQSYWQFLTQKILVFLQIKVMITFTEMFTGICLN